MTGSWRTVALLVAMVAGALLPQLHAAAPAIRWLVMAMLGVVFLGVEFSWRILRRSHLALLGVNIVIGLAAWGGGWLVGGRDVALAAFFVGISPTAAAAPVIIRFLRGRVEYVVAAFVLTNVLVSALLPVLLPLVLGRAEPDAFARVAGSVGLLVFVPLAVAALVRWVHPQSKAWPQRFGTVSFGMWLVTLMLISANASYFLRAQQDLPRLALLQIGLLTAALCAVNFVVGRLLGGREYAREASQSLGQKNTSFTIYLAMTYATPLVALGPTCYVICHNLWNTWQLHREGTKPQPAAGSSNPTTGPHRRSD